MRVLLLCILFGRSFANDSCRRSNTFTSCYDGWVSCCPGGDGSYGGCASDDCSNPGVVPCEGLWMKDNCEAMCNPCTTEYCVNGVYEGSSMQATAVADCDGNQHASDWAGDGLNWYCTCAAGCLIKDDGTFDRCQIASDPGYGTVGYNGCVCPPPESGGGYSFLFDGCCRGDDGDLTWQAQGEMDHIDCERECDGDANCVAIETNGWNTNPTTAGGQCYHFYWNGAEGTRISNGNCITSGDQKCWKKLGFTLLRENTECSDQSNEALLGDFVSVGDCADACRQKDGCKNFIYGNQNKAGECYDEGITEEDCTEWETDQYDFYKLRDVQEEYIERKVAKRLLKRISRGVRKTKNHIRNVAISLRRGLRKPGANYGEFEINFVESLLDNVDENLVGLMGNIDFFLKMHYGEDGRPKNPELDVDYFDKKRVRRLFNAISSRWLSGMKNQLNTMTEEIMAETSWVSLDPQMKSHVESVASQTNSRNARVKDWLPGAMLLHEALSRDYTDNGEPRS